MLMSETRPKIALVTGANRGIGLEIVRQLAQRDFLVLMGARTLAKASAALSQSHDSELIAKKRSICPFEIDVAAPPENLAERVTAVWGGLDVLINNAGIYQADGLPDGEDAQDILDVDAKTLNATLAVNAFGPLRLAQQLAPLLRKSDDGRIVNVSSSMAQFASLSEDSAAYRLSKVLLNAITLQLHHAFADDVKVFAACPGWVRTEMGGLGAPKTVEQGADTLVWLATAPEPRSGGFYQERRRISW
jgi:NAD(P)-dependent dehydrogenase (short-subunit alcohol dehydrogenase family)